MLSKNNFKELTNRDAQSVPHYGLRKLSIGVASVLLSTTLYAGVNAQADTLAPATGDSTPTQTVAVNPPADSSATTPTDALAPTSTASTAPSEADQTDAKLSSAPAPASAIGSGSETTNTPTETPSPSSTVAPAIEPLVLMEQPASTATSTTDPTASVAQGIKDTGVGGTFNNLPQYTAKSSSIEFGGTNFTKISNNYTATLSREASFEFSVKGKFTLDGNQIKKDRQILLGTILFTNNYYTDPNNAAHNQRMIPSYAGQITVTSSNGKEIGYAELTYANGAEADWILHVTSDETWVDNVNISLNLPLAGYVGYFTDTAVYKNVTPDKPWVETIQTPDNTYKLTYKLSSFPSGWREYQNNIGRDKSSIWFTKIAPALQTNEKYPSATLQDTLGKEGPADATFGNYKYVIKVSGLGTPILAKPGVGFESQFYPVDQNNHIIAEPTGYYDNINGTSTKLADNLTAQQLYDQVGVHQTLYSAQDDGSILIATEITPADIHLSDERIIQELQHGSMLYAIASPENQKKIIENTLAFYHGVLKNTPLLTRSYFRVDDGNGFKDAVIDSTVQDVTPLASGRAPIADKRYYKVGAPNASASGDLLQHNYVYYVDGAEGNKVISTTDLAGKAGETKTVTVTIPTGYVLDQARTGTTPSSYVLKDGNNTPIYVYLKHATVQVTPDQPKTSNDKLPDNPTKTYPAGVTATDLNKTVTRTIKVVNPRTSQMTTATQPAKLSRTATVDQVTGAVKYGEWTPGQWMAFVPDAIAGYTPSMTQVATTPVDGTTKDTTVTITYTANPQSTNIYYVDHNHPATIVKTQPITGKTDQIVPVPNVMPTGWQLTPGQTVPSQISFSAQGHDNVVVEIEHAHTTVTPKQPKTPSDKLPDNPTKSYPAGVDTNDLNKTITRTIQVTDPHTQKVTTTNQPVHLTRSADVDEVDGTVTYGKWTTEEWVAFNTPNVPGYTPTQGNVTKTPVTDTTKDQTVQITYTANPQSTTVNYVDQGGQIIHTTTIKGVTDQTVTIPSEVPAGWQLMTDQAVPTDITFGPNGYPTMAVKIAHGQVTVTPDQPKTPSDKLPDNPTKGYPAGVAQDDLNKTLTRTIQVVDPHTQKMATTTQAVHLTRTATVDEVSGAVTYGQWTTDTWPQFTTPAVPGYTPTQAVINQATVTDTTKDQTVKITYTANPQSTTINYVDKDGKVVHTTPIQGVTDQTVTVPNEVPAGWQLVDGQTMPSDLIFGPAGHPVVTVQIEHRHVAVTPDQPKTPTDVLPNNPTKTYPAGVTQSDLNKTTTRTIQVVDPRTHQVSTINQSAHLTRTASVDEVSGTVTYGQWTTGEWMVFNALDVPGYTPTQTSVAKTTVTNTTEDETVKITYVANPQTTTVNYVDSANRVIHTTPLNGVTDQTVTVPNELPAGWKLSPNTTLPTNLTFSPTGHPIVMIHIEHGQVTVTPDAPKTPSDQLPDNPTQTYPTGVGADDLNKMITRTINVTDPHTQKVTTTTQQVHLTRTASVDEVTGAVDYTNWSTSNWNSFIPTLIAGYTPSTPQVDATVVTDQSQNTKVAITYTANPQSMQIVYVDHVQPTTVIKTQTISGVTDQLVAVPNVIPVGWQLAPGQEVPSGISFGPQGHDNLVIEIQHRHVTVAPDQPKTPMDTLPDNPTKHYPTGVANNDLNKTIVRTINVTDPHTQKVTTATQTVHLTQTADVDEVSGTVVYSKWTTGMWDRFAVPVVAGYTPSVPVLNQVTVVDSTEDQTITITYTANPQTTQIEYVTADGQVIHTTPIAGVTDQTVTVPNELPAGWRLRDGQTVPAQLTFGPAGHAVVKVLIEHGHVTVTPDSPKTPNDTLPDNPAAHYPTGVSADDLNKTVARTIKVVDPHTQKVTTTTQTVHLTRTADVDEVSGDVKYGEWSTGNWATFTTPAVAGYTPSTPQVIATKVTAQTPDAIVTITYTADPQNTVVNYVDGNGQIIHTTKLVGTTDQTISVPNEVPAGWQLVNNETIPTELTFTPDGYPATTVKIEHRHVTVTPDNPKTPGDELPNNPAKSYPRGVANDDLNKTVTRTINVIDPHTQKVATTIQTVHLTRTADVDEVTGEVKYGAWTTGEWGTFQAPQVAGYTPSTSQVTQATVTDQTKDTTIDIKYTANAQSTTVNYVDGNGKIVHTTKLTGTTDQTVPVPNEIPTGWQLIDNETVPTEITFTPTGHPTITVKVEHRHVTVTPNSPKTPSDTLPNNPTKPYPNGVAKDDLNKTVTRTIKVVDPHTQKATTTTQAVHLTRTADVDQVTGAVKYGAWTTGEWAVFETPAVAGYTPTVAEVAAMPVDAQTKDALVTITYTANQHTTHVNYVGEDDTVIHTTTLTGHTDETVAVPNEIPAGWQLIVGQTVPEHLTMTATGHADLTVGITHAQTTVTPDAPKTPADKLPDNQTKGYPTGVAKDDLNKTVTRTIKLINPISDKTTTIKQTVTLTRSATVDEVTSAVTYGAWHTDDWPAFAIPAIAGYQPSQAMVAKTTVDGGTPDQTVTITYQAQEQTIHVVLIDGAQILKDIPVAGPTGTTVQIPLTSVDQNKYKIVGDVPSEHTMVADDDTVITVHLTHRTTSHVETKTATRIIQLTLPDGTTVDVPQTAIIHRTVTTDLATDQTTFGPWSTAQWSAYQVPAITGHQAQPAQVPAMPVTAATTDQTINVTYHDDHNDQLPQTGDTTNLGVILDTLALASLGLVKLKKRER